MRLSNVLADRPFVSRKAGAHSGRVALGIFIGIVNQQLLCDPEVPFCGMGRAFTPCIGIHPESMACWHTHL